MINYKDPMLDSDFLKQLTMERDRELFAKVVALNIDEEPIEEIQGRVTQGSIPVDGNSIVRRTCSLTIAAQNMSINDYLWGLETKIKVFIGIANKINSNYPPIIWFKMGTFILTSFNDSVSASGHTVSIQGKDKMCLLNGDIGGNLTALSYDFGKVTVINKSGYSYTEQVPLKQIISKAVHDYAKEPYHNIIINDMDDCGLELIEYRGDSPIYFVYNAKTQEVSNMVLNTSQSYYVKNQGNMVEKTIAEMEQENEEKRLNSLANVYVWKQLTTDFVEENLPTEFYGYEPTTNQYVGPYNLIKVEKGMTCGYRTCELVYAGNLTASVGEPITAVLTKIVNMLGAFEYFYDLNGRFVFQKKQSYINTTYSPITSNEEGGSYVEGLAYSSGISYSF